MAQNISNPNAEQDAYNIPGNMDLLNQQFKDGYQPVVIHSNVNPDADSANAYMASRKNIIQDYTDWMQNILKNINTSYFSRGFGGNTGIQSGGTYKFMVEPAYKAGAKGLSAGLANLDIAQANAKESARRFDLLRKDQDYARSEAENNAKIARDEANKWYNWL